MNSTPNTKVDLISRADEQIARVSEQFSKIERDAAHDPSVGSAAQPPNGRLKRRGLLSLLSAGWIVGLVVVFILQSSRGGVTLIGAQGAPQLISPPSLPSKTPPFPVQPDP